MNELDISDGELTITDGDINVSSLVIDETTTFNITGGTLTVGEIVVGSGVDAVVFEGGTISVTDINVTLENIFYFICRGITWKIIN